MNNLWFFAANFSILGYFRLQLFQTCIRHRLIFHRLNFSDRFVDNMLLNSAWVGGFVREAVRWLLVRGNGADDDDADVDGRSNKLLLDRLPCLPLPLLERDE